MPPLAKPKWELFALAYFSGKSATESAKEAGYSPTGIAKQGYRLSQNAVIQARVRELQVQAEDDKVATVLERKHRLTEIIRARYPDFVECGADGAWVNIGPETPNAGAIAEIHSRTEYDEKTSKGMIYTSVKLHDPVKAIAELNKIEGSYAPTRTDITSRGEAINVPPQILVVSPQARSLTEKVLQGERTMVPSGAQN